MLNSSAMCPLHLLFLGYRTRELALESMHNSSNFQNILTCSFLYAFHTFFVRVQRQYLSLLGMTSCCLIARDTRGEAF